MDLYHGDALEVLKRLPDHSVNLVLTDPPYNVSVTTTVNGKKTVSEWDRIDGYIGWCISWLLECQRVLTPSNIWHIPPIPSNNRLHTCQKPVEILRRLCRVSSRPGDVVLDPFMGSGSTGVAAFDEGRKFIGIERDKHYFSVAENRLREHIPPMFSGEEVAVWA